jgi:hypothetical protein
VDSEDIRRHRCVLRPDSETCDQGCRLYCPRRTEPALSKLGRCFTKRTGDNWATGRSPSLQRRFALVRYKRRATKSRVNRGVQAWFHEGLKVKLPGATRLTELGRLNGSKMRLCPACRICATAIGFSRNLISDRVLGIGSSAQDVGAALRERKYVPRSIIRLGPSLLESAKRLSGCELVFRSMVLPLPIVETRPHH